MSESRLPSKQSKPSIVEYDPLGSHPIESWLGISHGNPQALSRLARVSRFFSRALTSEAAWRERTLAYLTVYPNLESNEGEISYENYFRREYTNLRERHLEKTDFLDNDGLLEKTRKKRILAILNVCVQHGLELPAKRMVVLLESITLSEAECYTLFTTNFTQTRILKFPNSYYMSLVHN